MYSENDYFKPQFKWQLVDFFVRQNILTRSAAIRMRKSNLYGKYKEIRERKIKCQP